MEEFAVSAADHSVLVMRDKTGCYLKDILFSIQ